MFGRTRLAATIVVLAPTTVLACASLRGAVSPPAIAQSSPEPVAPLTMPAQTMQGGKGSADAAYPPDFAVTVKGDGTVAFPQHVVGRIQGSNLIVAGAPMLTVDPDGSVKGAALKRHYRFDAEGALLDDKGHGVRIAPDGSVYGVGGEWRYRTVFAWRPEGGAGWDSRGWRALEIVALVMLENMAPQAIREGETKGTSAHAGDAGKDRGLWIPPPSEWFK